MVIHHKLTPLGMVGTWNSMSILQKCQCVNPRLGSKTIKPNFITVLTNISEHVHYTAVLSTIEMSW